MNAAIQSEPFTLRVFIALQCMDVLTTLVFLSRGVTEGNPLMTMAFSATHAPWVGLVAAKLMAAYVGQFCYRSGRMGLLRRANTGYSLVVGWNLIAIAASLLAH